MLRFNAHPQPDELVRSQCGYDRLKPIMSASRTTFSNPYFSEWQSKIVGHDDQLLARQFRLMLTYKARNRLTTKIHVGLRLDQLHQLAFKLHSTSQRATFAAGY